MIFRSRIPLFLLFIIFVIELAPLIADRQLPGASGQLDRRSQLHGLTPGEFVVYPQKVPIEVVLIGFDESHVNVDDLRGWLPATYRPVVRYPRFYGLQGRDLGLEYTFEYLD